MVQIFLMVFIFTCLLSLAFFQSLYKDANLISGRLRKFTTSAMKARQQDEDELSKPFSQRVIRPMLQDGSAFVSRFIPSKGREKLQNLLLLAGNPGNLKAHEYQALHYLLILLLLLTGWIIPWLAGKGVLERFSLSLMGALVGILLGKAFLDNRARARQAAIQKELPDVMDLLTVSVEAGLGFDGALYRVVEKSKGFLAKELTTTLQELQMGKGRREALLDLGTRTGVEDLQTFISSINQADQLGISISKVIRIQAEQIRVKRRQRVEEKAMKAPIKMLIPLVFFIFPSIFIVLLGPAAIQIYKSILLAK